MKAENEMSSTSIGQSMSVFRCWQSSHAGGGGEMVTFYVCTIVQRSTVRVLRIATTQLGINRPATRITVIYAYGLVLY